VPAIVVFRWSIGKRVIVWMPDLPAVSAAQFSALPDAKRRDDADAGDGDDRTSEMVEILMVAPSEPHALVSIGDAFAAGCGRPTLPRRVQGLRQTRLLRR
jgi:hypothetical protein